MWDIRDLESATEQRLREELGPNEGPELFAAYLSARKALVEDILPEIKSVEPKLTDHSPDHVARVLDRAGNLVGEITQSPLTACDLYFLILSIQFHDAGNIYGRNDHQKRTAEIYNFVRSHAHSDREELLLLSRIVGAHTGTAPDGSKDTLNFLDHIASFRGRQVKLRDVAATLRLADECEEGPARTSKFMQGIGYDDVSARFHQYAQSTRVFIDRGNNRIALTYHIDIPEANGGQMLPKDEQDLRDFLEFIYSRVHKLDQERRYASHYSKHLAPFRRTTVVFNFWHDGTPQDMGIGEVELSDLVVPGDEGSPQIHTVAEGYTIHALIEALKTHMAAQGAAHD